MGTYSVPEEIRSLKPKGTMVKKLNGDKYYVYEYSTSKVKVISDGGKQRWKTVTKMGACIGSITLKDGYVPNNSHISTDEITSLNYGDYAFVVENAQNTFELLRKKFSVKDSEQIFSIAVIFFVEGFTYMKNIKSVFSMSYLSMRYPDVSVGYKALHSLYTDIGTREKRVKDFENMMVQASSKRIAIDGHVIACTSEQNDLSEYGYKARKLGTEQINWLTAYDVVTKKPLLSRLYNGADPDKTSVQDMLERYSFSNTEFLVDRGFNTDADKKLMSKNGNTYIVPMISGRKDYATVIDGLGFDKRRYFVYNKESYASMIYYKESAEESKRYIAYQDTTRAGAERQDYIKKMEAGVSGCSEEGLAESEKYFGLFLLETNNMDASCEEVFCKYKERWSIETYYNYVRNDADFNALYQQDYFCMQGLSFIVTISGMIYHDIRKVANDAKLPMKDIMRETGKIKISKEGDKWVLKNKIKKVREICEKVGFELPKYLKSS